MRKRNGIAEGARLQVEAFRRAGVEAELLDASPALRNPAFRIQHAPATAYVFHSGGPQLPAMVAAVLPHASAAWRIAYWAWELPTPPHAWPKPRGLVSEIWTPSTFARDSLTQRFTEPVQIVPHVLVLPPAATPQSGSSPEPSSFGPQGLSNFTPTRPFTVLTLADSRSSHMRKNPAGAISAFCHAFGPTDGARLIVKLNGAAPERIALLGEAHARTDIEIISGFLSTAEMHALFRSADVLISLHRAEGFGLPMLEAMAHGLPVVATGWSGNLDFMDGHNSLLIPATTVPVHDASVYSRHSSAVWAEPDEAAASAALLRLRGDPALRATLSRAAVHSARVLAQQWRIPPQA